jgi:hypothetical protein
MPPRQPADTPDSIREITQRLDQANEHLGSIAGSLGKLATTLDHYRPALDKAARLAGSPAGAVVSALARRSRAR